MKISENWQKSYKEALTLKRLDSVSSEMEVN